MSDDEQYAVQLAIGSLNNLTESSATSHPVQFMTSSEPSFRFLQAWLMATHSWSWKGAGLWMHSGEINDGSVQPAT